MTTTTTKKITIALSDRPPVTVDPTLWPRIASADWYSGEHECQANEVAFIRVRRHKDGRAIVYGERDRGPGGMHIWYRGTSAGFLVDALQVTGDVDPLDTNGVVRAIRRVAGVIGMESLGDECIQDLPAEEL